MDKIGRYQIKRELGRGGMAGVYEAHDPRFERAVAIKVLPRELMVDTMFRARFEREAKVIASLEHPGIVPVYDYGEDNGQPYLVMQFLAGGSLADRLSAGRLTLAETSDLMGRIAPAVDHANSRGISHRDLKPANIVFDRGGEPRVADFGIARISESKTVLTQGVIGTPAYMSPEQWEGIPLDARSDVYSLGVMAFEMLTGQTPYVAETMTGFMKAHLMNDIPDARDRVPDLPAAVQQVLARALAKARDQRYGSASEFSRDLAEVARQNSPSAAPAATSAAPQPFRPSTAPAAISAVPQPVRPNTAPAAIDAAHQPVRPSTETVAIGAAPQPVRPHTAPDGFGVPASPARRRPTLAIVGILAGVLVLGAIIALGVALSRPGDAPAAPLPSVPATAAATAAPAANTATPTPIPTRAPTVALAATATAPAPLPTPTVATPTSGLVPARTAAPTRSAPPAGTARPITGCAGVRPAHTIVVSRFSCWRYLDSATDPGPAWREYSYDDTRWSAGKAEFGYGDTQTTTLSFGTDPLQKNTTTFYRQPFTVTNIGGLAALYARVWRDDGIVLYLNGVEVMRDNMPRGVITPGTYALATISDQAELAPLEVEISATALYTGLNVLAAEIHQDRPDSSDIRFGLELTLVPAGVTFTRTACLTENPIGVSNAVLLELGCMEGGLTTIGYLQQDFERGRMIVFDRSGDPKTPGGGNIYVLIDGGLAYRDSDTFRQTSEDPDSWYACQATPGQRPEQSGVPWRGFGVVWCKSAELRAAIGRVKPGSVMRVVGQSTFQGYQGGRAMRFVDFAATFSSQDQRFPGLISGFWR